MTKDSTTPPSALHPHEASAATFRTTRWTQVGRAKADSEEGRRALAGLCEAYYEPVAMLLQRLVF